MTNDQHSNAGTAAYGPSRRRTAWLGLAVCTGALLALPPTRTLPLQSQEQPRADAGDGLIYEREHFVYVASHRDPFLPAQPGGHATNPDRGVAADAILGGARVKGLIHHARAALSLVLLADADSVLWLRPGQTFNEVRLILIQPDQVVLEVATPTGTSRRILQVPGADWGGSQ